jgi:hypothetical protein
MKTSRFFALLSLIIGIAFAIWAFFSSSHIDKTQSSLPAQKLQSQKPRPKVIPPSKTETVQEPVNIKQPREKIGETSSFFKEIAILTGFSEADLQDKQHYEAVPFIMRFGIDLKPAIKHSNPKDLIELEIEPFVSFVASPDTNAEAGTNILVKYGRFITKKICLYIEGGTGFIYITQHTREQSTQFNFADSAGAGVHYFMKDNLAINLGYRYRHISNCSIDHPNKGIDSNMVLAGISWFF